MRPIIALFSLLAFPALSLAECISLPPCAVSPSSAGCDIGDAASWSCGHVPATGDAWRVLAGHAMLVSRNLSTIGGIGSIEGLVRFEEGPGNRGPDGFRNLDVTCVGGDDITIGPTGVLRLRMNDRLRFDSTDSDECSIRVMDGGLFDSQGDIFQTTIAADGVTASTDRSTCGSGSGGRKYVIRLDALPPDAESATLLGRRIVFNTGRAVTRHYEIVGASVPARTVTVCTDYADANSAGQRLTPHATLPVRTKPLAQHSQPAPGPNSSCTGRGTPESYGCCTGPGKGVCLEALPAGGDTVTIVRDAWIQETQGSHGVVVIGAESGNSVLPILRATNITQLSADQGTPNPTFRFRASTPGLPSQPIEYNNIHDQNAFAPLRLEGWQNVEVAWNAIHDDGLHATPVQAAIYVSGYSAEEGTCRCGPDAVTVHHNTVYRTVGNLIDVGDAGDPLHGRRARIFANTAYQGCTAGGLECRGIEMDSCDECEAYANVVYDLYGELVGELGDGVNSDLSNIRGAIYDNWIVNLGAFGIVANPTIAVTHNYVSHTERNSVARGRLYSNLLRNAFLRHSTGPMVEDSAIAEGNYLIGVEDALFHTSDCAENGCPRFGFLFTNRSPPSGATLADNVVTSLGPNYYGGAVFLDEAPDLEFEVLNSHMTFDNRARTFKADKRLLHNGAILDPAPYTVACVDTAAQGLNEAPVMDCAACTYQDVYATGYILRNGNPAQSVGATVGLDSETGLVPVTDLGYRDPRRHDFNLTAGAPMLTAGSSPAGSPVGVRAFRFDRARFRNYWGGLLSWDGEQPVGVSNVPNTDTDGDGVIDLHDDCIAVPDPGQHDQDGDGEGDACDADADGDGRPDERAWCPGNPDPSQPDGDADGWGDACDPCPLDPRNDRDGDGVCAADDICPSVWDALQRDGDGDQKGDACDGCPLVADAGQTDADEDGWGDACDPCLIDPSNDVDRDGVCANLDNCPFVSNSSQQDREHDGIGDSCDNCPLRFNPDQTDSDADGKGDVCDSRPQLASRIAPRSRFR